MYVIGQDHPHKRESVVVLEKLVSEKARLVTNTEVFQEILHRYTAIHRRDAIQPAFDCLYGIVDEVFEVVEEDILAAKDWILSHEGFSARDALHVAQMKRHKIKTIFSFDRVFEKIPSLKRIPS